MIETDEDIRRAWKETHLDPLWESPLGHRPPPGPAPAHKWSWADVRRMVDFAFGVTNPAAVERRVLQLISPDARAAGQEYTTRNIAAAIQGLLPGEVARPHRHSMNALRFILEGSGAETTVNGKVSPMEQGDLVLTPAWCWHDHRHLGTAPMVWLDVLDVPLHTYLGTSQFQPGPVNDIPESVPEEVFAVPNILPPGLPSFEYSPVFRYPYANAIAALDAAPRQADRTKRVRYVNPTTGGASLAFLDTQLIEVEAGPETVPTRTNASSVCAVVEGEGKSKIGDKTIEWGKFDIFTIPQSNWVNHKVERGKARIVNISDRDVLGRLGLLKEEVGSA